MDLAGYVINAVVVEGRSVAEVAKAHGVSRSWLYELLARYRAEGDGGLQPRSKRPHRSPTRRSMAVEDQIVALRKSLADQGLDAGAHTIHYHLSRRRHRAVPSVATIWRVLSRRGFIVPQPQKRPRSSWRRFQAELPNECWQADTTHWVLADGTDVEILNVLDDHSRLLAASRTFPTTKAGDVVESFHQAANDYGYPASMLTDNGAIFTAESRHGTCAIELELLGLGSPTSTPAPTTLRPAARSNASTRPSRNGSPSSRRRSPSPTSRPSSTGSGPTTTLCVPTEPWVAEPRPKPSPPAPKPLRAGPASPSPPTTGYAETRSTRPAGSPSATTANCCTSASGGPTSEPGAAPGRRPRRPRHHRNRRAAPAPHHRPNQELPTPWTTLRPSRMSRDNRPGCLATSHGVSEGT